MKKLTRLPGWLFACLIVFFSFSSFRATAQTPAVKGQVTDTLNKSSMANAVVYLKSIKDSSLVSYTRVADNGSFALPALTTESKYIMVVSYPNYVDWIDTINVANGKTTNIDVFLTTKAHILQEVIVKQTIAPIRIKGDTTEYMADSFHVRAGATVEDLLKIMPGISVNSKGEITTQGQKVQKVLVDGDEFFGDDPTMATKNLNAKDVAKVQVFDKKSDQATLTGIDDGTKEKTVNLILKEDAKKGYFGRVEGGTDFDKYYSGKVSANRFTSTLKAGALIIADRTGRGGMNWEEMQDFGSISTTVDNGNVSFSWEGDGDFDSWGQQGVPESVQSAFMLNKKYGRLKSGTINNFSYNHLNLAGDGYTATKYILDTTVNYNNQSTSSKSSKWKNTFNTKNEFNIDSLTTISFNAKGSFGKSSSAGITNTEYLNSSKVAINTSERTNTSAGDNNNQKADIFLKRKLNTTGTRNFTVSTGFTSNSSNSEGFLLNKTSYYSNGLLASTQTIDQKKVSQNSSKTVQALASYVEPLSKKMSLNLNYTFNTSNTQQDTRSYEKSNGKYDSLNLLYSNNYRFVNSSHRAGFVWNYTTKKVTARAGLGVQDLRLKQTNIFNDSTYSRSFTNYFPNANLTWKYTASGNLRINYNGNTQQPSLMQLQPIANNNDPLNVVIGNPNLKPAFNHNININLGDYKVLSGREIGLWGNVNFTENAFSSLSVVDSLGRRTTQTVNVSGNYSYYFSPNYGRKIKFMNLQLNFSPGFNGGRNISFVNGVRNVTQNYTFSPSFSINRYVEKKGSIYISYTPNFSHSESSINPGVVTEYWIHRINLWSDYKFKKGWSVNTDVNANYRQKINADDRNNNAVIWNVNIEKKIVKKADITAIFTINDLLNQRVGFNRNISSNYITESTYTTVQRYAMLSLRWKFNKNRKSTDDDDE